MGREDSERAAIPVTRIEVLDFVGEMFGSGTVTRDELVCGARTAGARRELLEVLAQLPADALDSVDALWSHLEVPEDLSAAGY